MQKEGVMKRHFASSPFYFTGITYFVETVYTITVQIEGSTKYYYQYQGRDQAILMIHVQYYYIQSTGTRTSI